MADNPTPNRAARRSKGKKGVTWTECFSFEHDGETHTFQPTYDVLTPGFLRENRRRDEIDAFFTMVEALVPEGQEGRDMLDLIDNMSRQEFRALMEDFYAYMEADPGE